MKTCLESDGQLSRKDEGGRAVDQDLTPMAFSVKMLQLHHQTGIALPWKAHPSVEYNVEH